MIDRYAVDGDAASNLLERRWFAALNSARSAQTECEVFREVMNQAESAWRCARARLERLEKLRDALGEDLAALDMIKGDVAPQPTGRRIERSAA